MEMRPRILALDGAWDLHVAFDLTKLPISSRRVDQLKLYNVYSFDIIILQSHADVTKLGPATKDYFDKFRRKGGTLILFAPAENCQPTQGVHFEIKRLSQLSIQLGDIAKKLIPDISDPRQLRLHDLFICHAIFDPASDDDCALITVEDTAGRRHGVLGIIKGDSESGDLIISTIDFDYHALHGPTFAEDAAVDEVVRLDKAGAKAICKNIVDFAVERWKARMKLWSFWMRRLRGWIAPKYLPIPLYILGAIVIVLVLPALYKYKKETGDLVVYIIVGIITAVKALFTALRRE